MVGFDCAHGAGNVNLNLHDSGADFAIWCSYKYLNSGPGNLSGCFIHERHACNKEINKFRGWWGNDLDNRFNMRKPFKHIDGADGWQISTPTILSMAAIKASLEIFDKAGVPDGVFNVVNGYGPLVGAALSEHPDVAMMSFTGSTEAGIAVALSLIHI